MFDFLSKKWTLGPEMKQPRYGHMCGKMHDNIIIFGGYKDGKYEAKTTDFMFLWSLNKDFTMNSIEKNTAKRFYQEIGPLSLLEMLQHGDHLLIVSRKKRSDSQKYVVFLYKVDLNSNPESLALEPLPNQKNLKHQFENPIAFSTTVVLPSNYLRNCSGKNQAYINLIVDLISI